MGARGEVVARLRGTPRAAQTQQQAALYTQHTIIYDTLQYILYNYYYYYYNTVLLYSVRTVQYYTTTTTLCVWLHILCSARPVFSARRLMMIG